MILNGSILSMSYVTHHHCYGNCVVSKDIKNITSFVTEMLDEITASPRTPINVTIT